MLCNILRFYIGEVHDYLLTNDSPKQSLEIIGLSFIFSRPIIFPVTMAVITVPSRIPSKRPRKIMLNTAPVSTTTQSTTDYIVGNGMFNFPAMVEESPSMGIGTN